MIALSQSTFNSPNLLIFLYNLLFLKNNETSLYISVGHNAPAKRGLDGWEQP
jgi:hypothetical protein